MIPGLVKRNTDTDTKFKRPNGQTQMYEIENVECIKRITK